MTDWLAAWSFEGVMATVATIGVAWLGLRAARSTARASVDAAAVNAAPQSAAAEAASERIKIEEWTALLTAQRDVTGALSTQVAGMRTELDALADANDRLRAINETLAAEIVGHLRTIATNEHTIAEAVAYIRVLLVLVTEAGITPPGAPAWLETRT